MAHPRSIQPARCAICTHAKRARIELARVGGASLDAVAATFAVSRYSVHRHFKKHVTKARRIELMAGPVRVTELANAAAGESHSLLEQLQIVRSVLLNQFLNAAECGDRPQVANVGGRLLESLRQLGAVTGELRQLAGISITNNTLNVTSSPQFEALQEGLLRIARGHPAARAEIVALLRALDEQPPAATNGAPLPLLIEGAANAA